MTPLLLEFKKLIIPIKILKMNSFRKCADNSYSLRPLIHCHIKIKTINLSLSFKDLNFITVMIKLISWEKLIILFSPSLSFRYFPITTSILQLHLTLLICSRKRTHLPSSWLMNCDRYAFRVQSRNSWCLSFFSKELEKQQSSFQIILFN